MPEFHRTWIPLATCLWLFGCSTDEHAPVDLAITSVTVIDVESGAVLKNQTILLESDRIIDVKSNRRSGSPDATTVIDGKGLYAIPGLWDMHIHMLNDQTTPVPWDFYSPGVDEPEQREIYMPLYLAFGVTGTRELSGGLASIALREQIKTGEILGPHMVVGSPLLEGANPIWPDSAHIKVGSPERAREVVSELHSQGFDFLKTYNLMSAESYRALHQRAKELDMEVSGEIPIGISLWEAAELGHRTVEHLTGVEFACSGREDILRKNYVTRIGNYNADTSSEDAVEIWNRSEWEPFESLDPKKCAELYTHLADHNTWVVPTLYIQRMISHEDDPEIAQNPGLKYLSRWENDMSGIADEFDPERRLRPLLDYRLTVIDNMLQAGVGVLAGSDTPGGFTLHMELKTFVDGGLTPLEALQTATTTPARYLQREAELGSIEPGKIADILLLRNNPLEDIEHLSSIETVIFQGHVLDREKLDRMLDQVEVDAREWPE